MYWHCPQPLTPSFGHGRHSRRHRRPSLLWAKQWIVLTFLIGVSSRMVCSEVFEDSSITHQLKHRYRWKKNNHFNETLQPKSFPMPLHSWIPPAKPRGERLYEKTFNRNVRQPFNSQRTTNGNSHRIAPYRINDQRRSSVSLVSRNLLSEPKELSTDIIHFSASSESSASENGTSFGNSFVEGHVRNGDQRSANSFSEMTTSNANTSLQFGGKSQKTIYIHGLFEVNGWECRDHPDAGPFEFKAAQLAIQHVNDRHVIPGYRLEMYENDTKCDSGVAVDSFFYALYRQPRMTMVLGTGSSEVTERLARVVSRWNITQVSYGASSPALSDRKNFPMFYRTVAPDSSHNAALLVFIQHFRWDAVAAVHEQGDQHALPINKMVTDLEQINVSVTFTKGVSDRDYKDHLQELKAMDCRIIIGSFSYSLVKKIFCQVYHLGMFGAEYAWILQGNMGDHFWKNTEKTDCTEGQLAKAAEGLIIVGSHYGLVGNATSVSTLSTAALLEAIGYIGHHRGSGFVTQIYDAVWVIALTLRRAEEEWRARESDSSLTDYSYSNHEMAQNISDIVGKLQFMGVSGPVSFHGSDRVGITAFHQNQGGELVSIALYYPDATELDFSCPECRSIIWQGGSVPIARRIIKLRVAILDRTVYICMTALAVFGVALAITFLSFNLYYRRFKFIKLSSPNLNNFVVVGCVLVYVAVILLGIDHGTLASDDHFSLICAARAFLLSGGFSLAFGCMFIKTYRVYHIFIRTNTGIVKSKLLHDQQLLGMVSVLVLIDCVLVTLWVTVDPMERQLQNLTMQVNRAERNVVYLDQREQCNSSHMAKWLGSLYIYKGLLLVVGCYMAWETRHVKIPALNDSQYIGMSVYNVVITSVIVVALANVIPVERYTLTFVLVATLIFVSTTTTLCLLFVPKIHTILKNPEESAVVATPGVKVECKTRRFVIDEPRESIYRAEVLNRALKRELAELDQELGRLTGKKDCPSSRNPHDTNRTRGSSDDCAQQDDDSDDGLPPWLAEYKEYSSTGSDDIWYTGSERILGPMSSRLCASALNAIRPMALSTTEKPTPCTSRLESHGASHIMESGCNEGSAGANTDCSSMRSSLPAMMMMIDCRPKLHVPATGLHPVRGCLSDRALNKTKVRDKSPLLSPVMWGSTGDKEPSQVKTPYRTFTSQLQNVAAAIFLKQPTSEPRLATFPLTSCGNNSNKHNNKYQQHHHSNSDSNNSNYNNDGDSSKTSPQHRATRSLPKIPSVEGSHSIFSGNSTSGSAWTTAPLYCSTSFSTPPEDFSSSIQQQTTTPPPTPSRTTPSTTPPPLPVDTMNGEGECEVNVTVRPNLEVPEGETPSVSSMEVDSTNAMDTVYDITATNNTPTNILSEGDGCGENGGQNDEDRDRRIQNLRNQIFCLERDLILLELDRSESVDL